MADQVTISTFLELRDNLSEGMKKAAAAIEAATGRVRKARSDEERAAKDAIRNQARAEKEIERHLRERERNNEREDKRQARRAEQVAREKAQADAKSWSEWRKSVDAASASEKKREREVARAQKQMLDASQAAHKQKVRKEEAEARKAEEYQKKLTAATWREEQRRITMAERAAAKKAATLRRAQLEVEKSQAAIIRSEARTARAQIQEIKRVDRARAEAHRHHMRGMKAREEKVPDKKTGLFGTMVGANITADAISMAASYGVRAVRGFYESAVKNGKTYEKQISAIAGSIFTQGLTGTYSRAKEKTVGLIDTIRKLAAKLPGEAQDYVKVFTLTLPSALARGITDTQKYAEMVSKYTAIAVQRGYKGQAGYQLNEILQGRVRVTTNMFQVLAPYMGLTSREFNKITDNAERMRVVFNAIEKSAGALPAVAKDAESIFGTLRSQLEMLSVTGQFPLFESMKIAAVKLSEIISGPGLGTFVRDISTALGDLTVGAVVFFKFMFDQASRFANWIGEKLSGIPGFDAAASAFRSLREVVAFADPFQTMMKIGAEERKKWRSQEEVDIRREGRIRPHKFGDVPSAPGERAQSVVNFNNNRFEIKQEFAEGFDPDRIAFAFASDLTRLGEMKLQAAYSLTGGSVR